MGLGSWFKALRKHSFVLAHVKQCGEKPFLIASSYVIPKSPAVNRKDRPLTHDSRYLSVIDGVLRRQLGLPYQQSV